jgi:PAS domain S-box-containing protein
VTVREVVRLPPRAKAVVVAAFSSGLIILSMSVVAGLRRPIPDLNQWAVFATLTVFLAATWIWPLVMYRGDQSEAVNLDEGFFIIMALLLPWGGAVLVFAVATAVAQIVRRPPLVKAVFNWGQAVTSAGLGLVVVRLLAPATPRLTVIELVAAAAGAVVFSIVQSCAMATMLASLGTSWFDAIGDGVEIRVRLVGSCIAVATMSALAISAYRWSLPLAVLPLVVLRQVLAGHFQARHDRARLLGLFNAALEANRTLGESDVLSAILDSAQGLLRCPVATVSTVASGPAQLGAMMPVNDQPAWLVVSGRSRNEPFDAADKALLEALAAVGAGALTNVHHYREGRFQRERLAAITSSLGEGVCALDQAGQITFMNPAASRMLGWEMESGSDTAPSTPSFLLSPAMQVMETRKTVRSDDTEFQHRDHTPLPVAFTASAIVDDDQDPVAGAVIVFRDISERREVETAIRVARDQAIEASRLKSQFLANMSHEIRTPMNGVLGISRLLLETNVDETQRKYLAAIRDSGENLMVIINDILDFSKIEAGKLSLEEVDFDLGGSLASVANALTVQAHDKGLRLHLEIDPRLPRWVRGDPVRFRQVLTNLVGNAVKFTPVGSVTVTAAALDGGRVRFEVVDTGIGIDPALRATVLDAFGQADSSTTRRYGGTGLGLAICSQLVGMMGGALDFVSRPGEGSMFWFEVPFGEAATIASAPAAASASVAGDLSEPGAPSESDGSPVMADRPRILVADDAPVSQMVASMRLERLGYQVDIVSTGEEAIVAVQQNRYQAVLMDCRMSVMDGCEATRRIRGLDGPAGATPIIAMTASVMDSDREECLFAGMDDYLVKPLDAQALAAALARVSPALSVSSS